MLPEDDRMIETCRSVFKCFNVNFRLLKTIYVHLLACHLNRCNAPYQEQSSVSPSLGIKYFQSCPNLTAVFLLSVIVN